MRLIDADALITDVRKNSESYFADDFTREWLDRQPTIDAVEVRRCRDCKYFEIHVLNDYDIGEVELTSCAAFGIGDIHSDDYCSFGQRREDGK